MMPGRALVTGAGTRLGKAMAEALGADGWAVGVHYRASLEGAEATAEAIAASGSDAFLVQADLADEDETASLVERAEMALGGTITLLINSASTFFDDTATTHTRATWDVHMAPNLRAPILLSQQFAKALPKDTPGLILNLIDQRVWNLAPDFFTYTLSKAALWQATQTLAQALAPNIRVNAIGPGPTLKSIHQSEEDFAAEAAATLTRQGSNPAEIVNAMRYLISASSVTGQMIASDGGQHLMRPPAP
jgi:NAD(P)-dependent dehydrogenase (short-subunit alcohol dehydrogenase family)